MADPSIHDLGGRPGYGPVPVDHDAIFEADWERKAFAVTQFAQGAAGFNTDAFRHGLERERPDRYGLPYWHRWVLNGERMLVEGGVIAEDAVDAHIEHRPAEGRIARTTDALPPEKRNARREPVSPPQFSVGEPVAVASEPLAPGHTRLPEYVRGQRGTVVIVNDVWIFPDTHAHGRGEQPCWVYAVSFRSGDLWPDSTESAHSVVVDLFEPYLRPVPTTEPVPTNGMLQ